VLTFSVPLDPDQNFAQTVHVVDKKNGKVDGAWELSTNLKELRLRHLEPNRELLVSVDRGLVALNKATLVLITKRRLPPVIFSLPLALPAAVLYCLEKWWKGCRLWRLTSIMWTLTSTA
jgi:hypothetical protein